MPFEKSGRTDIKYYFRCTKDDPWDRTKVSPDGSYFKVVHPDSVVKFDEGDYEDYENRECPNCGHYFTVEIAQ